MKKGFLIGILTAFALLVVVNVSAQERALGKDRKSLQKYEKVLNKDLKKKALKEARKEAKRLTKEGFRTPVGKLPLDKQIEDAWQKQAELDMEGNPTYDVHFNPNGSAFAVEGITSPDGRVFGKMGHSERIGSGLYRNVPGNFEIGMFRAAVKYFRS